MIDIQAPGVAELAEALVRYEPPRLIRFGDLRELTLGSSPGPGDSGNPADQRVVL
jgi:hypothetical protein